MKKKKKQPVINKVEEPAISYKTETQATLAHTILDVNSSLVEEPLIRIDTFRKGFRKKSFENLKAITGLDNTNLASALAVSTKTLQRKQVFDSVQSEKMYELAELYALGISYFGKDGFKRWMERPLFSLGNRKPLALIDISEGLSLLKDEIMKVQYGIAV